MRKRKNEKRRDDEKMEKWGNKKTRKWGYGNWKMRKAEDVHTKKILNDKIRDWENK